MNRPTSQNPTTAHVAALSVMSILMLMSSVIHSRPKLESTCSGGIPIAFARACDSHAAQGYVPLRRQLSDGSCMNMCCQQDPNGNISCVSDPNSIPSKASTPRAVLQPGVGTVAPQPRTPVKALTAPVPGVLPNTK
jgi:hypothetical protein